jgi:hypothetical protein
MTTTTEPPVRALHRLRWADILALPGLTEGWVKERRQSDWQLPPGTARYAEMLALLRIAPPPPSTLPTPDAWRTNVYHLVRARLDLLFPPAQVTAQAAILGLPYQWFRYHTRGPAPLGLYRFAACLELAGLALHDIYPFPPQ